MLNGILDHNDSAIAMAGFILKNTLSDNGGVTRGVCKVVEGHTHITDVVETSNIVKTVEDGMIGAEANGCLHQVVDSYLREVDYSGALWFFRKYPYSYLGLYINFAANKFLLQRPYIVGFVKFFV